MSGTVLVIDDIIQPDRLGCQISQFYIDWENRRQPKVAEWQEVQQYIFATDTTKTGNAKLPWSNKTTLPKLCQIRDNLFANYMASMFPKRKWMIWEGATAADEDRPKRDAIEAYMSWVVDRNQFYNEMAKLVLDYIDYGNCFGTVEWIDKRSSQPVVTEGLKPNDGGFVGPQIRRISPLDIVFNPLASDFQSSPKIVRSLISIGELQEMLDRQTDSDAFSKEDLKEIWNYIKDYRYQVGEHTGSSVVKDNIFQISGFDTFTAYLESKYVEILTFYGDIYDEDNQKFERNQMIQVVDRHKVISKKANPSLFGSAPIFHAGWRVRPDNLWAMGPLDNLVGMQYRIDHLENMKADVFDLIAYPPMAIMGAPPEFIWGPMERIYLNEGEKVELLSPQTEALRADNQIAMLEAKMEEMAGSPKEAMGFRTPGEKTKYEVQRLENAAGRIYQNKISQFERQETEELANGMLELARRRMDRNTIRIFDNELKIAVFQELDQQTITGNGRLKPIAARHFAEQAQKLQDINGFLSSPAAQDQSINVHFSGERIARTLEVLLDLQDDKIVQPYIRIQEQADAQRFMQSTQEQVGVEGMTPSGIGAGNHDEDFNSMVPGPSGPGGQGEPPPVAA